MNIKENKGKIIIAIIILIIIIIIIICITYDSFFNSKSKIKTTEELNLEIESKHKTALEELNLEIESRRKKQKKQEEIDELEIKKMKLGAKSLSIEYVEIPKIRDDKYKMHCKKHVSFPSPATAEQLFANSCEMILSGSCKNPECLEQNEKIEKLNEEMESIKKQIYAIDQQIEKTKSPKEKEAELKEKEAELKEKETVSKKEKIKKLNMEFVKNHYEVEILSCEKNKLYGKLLKFHLKEKHRPSSPTECVNPECVKNLKIYNELDSKYFGLCEKNKSIHRQIKKAKSPKEKEFELKEKETNFKELTQLSMERIKILPELQLLDIERDEAWKKLYDFHLKKTKFPADETEINYDEIHYSNDAFYCKFPECVKKIEIYNELSLKYDELYGKLYSIESQIRELEDQD